MQFALDENGNRVSIEKSIKGKCYKCPCCGTEVIQKKGEVMIWHFAHKSLADCVDYYDHKGEWHRAMQELFPEQNREVYEKTESYRHIFDVLTDDSRVIEFQHSPLSPGDFRQRTYDYCRRANLKKSPRPIWVFDFSEKDFCLSQKKYDDSRMRMFYWKRASKLFGDYRDYKKESGYELWMQIKPYKRGSEIGEQYGYPIYEKKFLNTGFIKVLGAYGDCKTIIGKVYTDDEFKKYITSV